MYLVCKSGCTITSKALINIFWNFFPITFLQALFRCPLSVREKISKKMFWFLAFVAISRNCTFLRIFASNCTFLWIFGALHSSSFSGDLTVARSPKWRFLYLTKILGLYQCQNQFLDLQVVEWEIRKLVSQVHSTSSSCLLPTHKLSAIIIP